MEAALRGVRGKLLGSFLALGRRPSEQQREIDGLEANGSVSTAMWAWREEHLALAAVLSGTRRLSDKDDAVSDFQGPGSFHTASVASDGWKRFPFLLLAVS
ncbi:hypothetical protein ACP70R_042301 [Stipagrostis hirtigluma subsp. patula]